MAVQGNISELNINLLEKLRKDLNFLLVFINRMIEANEHDLRSNTVLYRSFYLGAYSITLSSLIEINNAFTKCYSLKEKSKQFVFEEYLFERRGNEKLKLMWCDFEKYAALRNKIAHDDYNNTSKSKQSKLLFRLLKEEKDALVIKKSDYFEEIEFLNDSVLKKSIEFYSNFILELINKINSFENHPRQSSRLSQFPPKSS